MAVPVTELTPQQLDYFERGSAHTLEFRFINPLKDNRRRAIEKKLVYIVYSCCYTGDFGPWARFRHMAGQKNWKMRYLFKRLDQQTTTTAHPQWAMGTHRSALSLQLGRVVADLDTPFSFKFPLPPQARPYPLQFHFKPRCQVGQTTRRLFFEKPKWLCFIETYVVS